jgi:hypothetical protein
MELSLPASSSLGLNSAYGGKIMTLSGLGMGYIVLIAGVLLTLL